MRQGRFDPLPYILVAMVAIAFYAALTTFAMWRRVAPPGPPVEPVYDAPEFSWRQATFDELAGWKEDNVFAAMPPLALSCARIARGDPAAPANLKEALGPGHDGATFAGAAGDWDEACAAVRRFSSMAFLDPAAANAAARAVFEAHFRPVQIVAVRRAMADGPTPEAPPVTSVLGKFTGYFEPVYEGSATQSAARSAPALSRPDDLVMVDLGEFRDELAGQRIAGRVADGALVPYEDRRAIAAGALGRKARPLVWLDPDELFFMQIQGSGRVVLPDGASLRLGFAGQNGWPYVPIGKLLIERGEATREEMSMQTIKRWLKTAPPEAAAALRAENPSYVFFRALDDLPDPKLGPLGAEGVQLTPMRSVAVDRRYFAMGTPLWIRVAPKEGAPMIRQLMIAQDTGGAIRGPIRGDIYFGSGPVAGEEAGRMNAEGEAFALLPKAVAERLGAAPERAAVAATTPRAP